MNDEWDRLVTEQMVSMKVEEIVDLGKQLVTDYEGTSIATAVSLLSALVLRTQLYPKCPECVAIMGLASLALKFADSPDEIKQLVEILIVVNQAILEHHA